MLFGFYTLSMVGLLVYIGKWELSFCLFSVSGEAKRLSFWFMLVSKRNIVGPFIAAPCMLRN